MKITEIANKYFFAHSGGALALESYQNPEAELEVKFTLTDQEYNKKFYSGIVYDKNTGKKVVKVTFSLTDKNSEVDIGTIEPFDDPANTKIVHTSVGSYSGGADMGHTSMKWLLRKLKDFAKTQGFDIKKISSTTRSTGARAKNNPGDDGTGMPKHFDVSKKVNESIIYDCITETFIIKTI